MEKLFKVSYKQWFYVALINFLIVSVYGALMRYKFLFPLSGLDQKNLLHAHSHFAFTAWVSMALMLFMPMFQRGHKADDRVEKPYAVLLYFNLITSVCMLIAFTAQGYALLSIIFSTLSLFVSFAFIGKFWRDLNSANLASSIKHWYYVAIISNAVSAVGTFYLIYLKASHQENPFEQQASIYFYLHFQYNGWFFFGCLALFYHWLICETGAVFFPKYMQYLFSLSVIPTYFLTILWWKGIPAYVGYVVFATVLLQGLCWLWFLSGSLKTMKLIETKSNSMSLLWIIVALGVSAKLILQGFSIIPSMSVLVYGFRPIAIAYLHLVLLVNISMFLIGLAFSQAMLKASRFTFFTIVFLIVGILFNEIALALQGLGGIYHWNFTFTHTSLLWASIIIVTSLLLLLIAQRFKDVPNN